LQADSAEITDECTHRSGGVGGVGGVVVPIVGTVIVVAEKMFRYIWVVVVARDTISCIVSVSASALVLITINFILPVVGD